MSFPGWSPDDTYIYFVRGVPPDAWDIWRIRPSGAGLERITRHSTRLTYPVLLDGQTLLYLATDSSSLAASGHKDFWLIDLTNGARRLLAQMPEDFDVRDFDVPASGSQIVFDRVQAHSQLVLIERGR